MKKLLTIEAAFRITEHGWVIEPGLAIPQRWVCPKGAVCAELRTKQGILEVEAYLGIAHVNGIAEGGPKAWIAIRIVTELQPTGELWTETSIADQFDT